MNGRERPSKVARVRRASGQAHGERGAHARPVARRARRAAVQLGEPAHQGEADAEAAFPAVEPRVALDEELEGTCAKLIGHPDSGVADLEHGVVAGVADAYADRPAGGSELERVPDQVRD